MLGAGRDDGAMAGELVDEQADAVIERFEREECAADGQDDEFGEQASHAGGEEDR